MSVHRAKGSPFRKMQARLLADERRVVNRIRQLAQSPRPIAFKSRWGGFIVVHLDTYPSRLGQWRVSRLDAHGEPEGHQDARDYQHALSEARAYGADLLQEVNP